MHQGGKRCPPKVGYIADEMHVYEMRQELIKQFGYDYYMPEYLQGIAAEYRIHVILLEYGVEPGAEDPSRLGHMLEKVRKLEEYEEELEKIFREPYSEPGMSFYRRRSTVAKKAAAELKEKMNKED